VTYPGGQNRPRGNREDVQRLYQHLVNDFGHSSGLEIIRTITAELGGLRVTIPSAADIYREERALQIQRAYADGTSISVLASLWGISRGRVKKYLQRKITLPLARAVL
jgi:hypothetical protein